MEVSLFCTHINFPSSVLLITSQGYYGKIYLVIERGNEFERWFLAPKDFHRPALDKEKNKDFPGGPVVKNPLWNVGDPGSIPGGGTKTLRAEEQGRPRAVTPEPERHKRVRAAQGNVLRDAKKIPHVATETWCSQVNRYMLKKRKTRYSVFPGWAWATLTADSYS